MTDGDGAGAGSPASVHRRHPLWAIALAFGVGFCVVVQARSNGEMAVVTGDPLLTGVLSLVGGLLILGTISVLRPTTRRALVFSLPAELRARRLKPWHLLGGVGGAVFLAAQVVGVPLLGVAIVTVASVAGTTAMSVAVDRWGIGPAGVRAVSARRIAGAVGATVAVGVAVSGRFVDGDLVVWAVLLVLSAGAVVAVQLALNGVVAQRTQDPIAAAVVNFVLALVLLLLALGVEHLAGHGWSPPPAPWEQTVLWLGGPMGVLFISVAALVVRPLGVLLFGLLNVAGQLSGSLISDVVFPTPGTAVSWQLVAGAALALAAVAWTSVPARRRTAVV